MANLLPNELLARLRHEVHSYLAALSPGEAKALRARFGLDMAHEADDDEEALRALVREVVATRKRQKQEP